MHLSHLVFLAGALGATAHPSGHAHLHRSAHEKRAAPSAVFYKNVHHHHTPIPSPQASPAPAAPSAAAAPPPPPAPATPASSPASGNAPAAFKQFCSGGGAASKVKRVTAAQVAYAGNLGMDNGCPWGSNMMLVDNSIADKYTYVQVLTNRDTSNYQVRCGNKLGPDHGVNGMFSANGPSQLVFTLAPGETKTMAVQGNSQIVCAFHPDSVPTTTYGQYAGNWVESDFGNTSNNGWSGSDCSSLVAQAYNMDVPGCRVCSGGKCSTIHEGGQGDNAYTKGMEELDGIGLNLPAGPVTLTIDVGYKS
ncbi:hypothetical protein QBC47DRAFT_459221 [Echria macrotheca]|uniref:Allergen Asp f 4 n=1 Tax=Echria macrotheca TaxID=438768 RepID=A0AAJ0F8A5_9PEZI|nr:hypothetical protein QBC47DRAFT_459221 [Echria macrotheca]